VASAVGEGAVAPSLEFDPFGKDLTFLLVLRHVMTRESKPLEILRLGRTKGAANSRAAPGYWIQANPHAAERGNSWRHKGANRFQSEARDHRFSIMLVTAAEI
jgi:hypothetical protein